MRERAVRSNAQLAALAAAVTCTALLALRAGFDLDPFDSAELALAAVTRGLAHPPGQPLHTLLGWLLTRLPLPPLPLLALLSIVPAAVSVAVPSIDAIDRETPTHHAVLAGCVAAALFASRGRCADVSARVEVYALAAALAVAAIAIAARRTRGSDFVVGLLLGGAASTNPVVAVQGIGALAIATRGPRIFALARITAGGLFGLLPYAYVFSVGGRASQTLVWGAPQDLHGLLALLTAHDFQANVSLTPARFATNIAALAGDLFRDGTLLLVALGIVLGLATAPRDEARVRGLAAGVALAIGMAMISANVPYLPRNPDYGGYLLVPVALACAEWARLFVRIAPLARGVPAVLAAFVLVLLAIVPLRNARSVGVTRAAATAVLDDSPRGAIDVVGSDHLLFPMLYLQLVEHRRTDVVVLNPGWSSASWAWKRVIAADPSLHVSLAPGLGGGARLLAAIASRGEGRAVLAERIGELRAMVTGPVCPRGLLWSSSEGCDGARRELGQTVESLAMWSARAPVASWDRSIAAYSAQQLALGALELGCPGLALRFDSAGAGTPLAAVDTSPACFAANVPRVPTESFLDITPETLERAAAILRPIVATAAAARTVP